MRWIDRLLGRPEEGRASYTEAAIQAISAGTEGVRNSALMTSAVQAAADAYGRAFAAARVEGPERLQYALGPSLRADMARRLIVEGEGVWYIDVSDAGDVALYEAAVGWTVYGRGPDSMQWRYAIGLPGPTGERTLQVPAEGIVHPRYATEANQPHIGLSPLRLAANSAKLAGSLEALLASEASSPHGYLIPAPLEQIDNLDALKQDMSVMAGRTALVPSMSGGWGEGSRATFAPRSDWTPHRYGVDVPETLLLLRDGVYRAVYAAMGVPAELMGMQSGGTESREAWRRFLHGSIAPLGMILERELQMKLDRSLRLDFETLYASDVSGRARAFQSMVGGGMDVAQAATLAGLLDMDNA